MGLYTTRINWIRCHFQEVISFHLRNQNWNLINIFNFTLCVKIPYLKNVETTKINWKYISCKPCVIHESNHYQNKVYIRIWQYGKNVFILTSLISQFCKYLFVMLMDISWSVQQFFWNHTDMVFVEKWYWWSKQNFSSDLKGVKHKLGMTQSKICSELEKRFERKAI